MRAARLDRIQKEPTDLYFIESQCAEKFIKIGIASTVRVRLSKMQMDCPYRLKLLWLAPGMAHLEKDAHRMFAADCVGGEWFKRSDALLEFMASLPGRDTVDIPRAPWVYEPPIFLKEEA